VNDILSLDLNSVDFLQRTAEEARSRAVGGRATSVAAVGFIW